jgi:methionyl aminopeptidase
LQVAKQVVDDAVGLCGPGVAYSAIGSSIAATAAQHGFGIVRQFVGHGVGQVFHSHPIIYPYANGFEGGWPAAAAAARSASAAGRRPRAGASAGLHASPPGARRPAPAHLGARPRPAAAPLRAGAMVEGETFTIEPILALGVGAVREWPDGWTSVTVDRSIAAQFEHAVLVTKDGAECLTAYE